jgi:MFS family permease
MGLAFGLAETLTAMALFLAPPLAGFLYDRNPLSIYFLSLVLIAGSVLVSAILSSSSSSPNRAEEKLPTQEII